MQPENITGAKTHTQTRRTLVPDYVCRNRADFSHDHRNVRRRDLSDGATLWLLISVICERFFAHRDVLNLVTEGNSRIALSSIPLFGDFEKI